jgi:hypothetical protein
MYLHRVTDTWEWANPDGVYLGKNCESLVVGKSRFANDAQDWRVFASFPRFGGGEKRQSDYEVGIRWSDVESIIEKFCEVELPEAIAAREAFKLAAAAKDLGWHQPYSQQSN